ncbi:MAG: transketolase [Chloroflexi bacterium]|nr:transketolase [Chloroflexota bacterium]
MKKIKDTRKLKLIANKIRQDIIKSLTEAGSGHSAGPLGMADVLTALYFNVMEHDPKNPGWGKRDYFVLSNGHICPVLYATLANAGYFPEAELMTLRKLGSRLQGHPHRAALPGLETTSGPLGSGLSQAAGMAYGLKMDQRPNRVFCLTSDGEHNEGNIWEAVLFIAKNKLDNLTAILDRNYIQIDGNTEDVMPLDPVKEKYLAFNWNVIEIDGNNMEEILTALSPAKRLSGKPAMVIARNVPGKGVSFMENNYEWHGKPPTSEQAEIALAELEYWREKIVAGEEQ